MYLYVHNDMTFEQSFEDITQEDLQAVDEGELEILQYESGRHFCRALVEQGEDGKYEIIDWEMVTNK